MPTNLPKTENSDSASEVKEFFNQYLTEKISFPSNEVDAVIGNDSAPVDLSDNMSRYTQAITNSK